MSQPKSYPMGAIGNVFPGRGGPDPYSRDVPETPPAGLTYECSGRGENGSQDPWGCRHKAVAGFVSASGTEQRKVFLICGIEHSHPCMKPLDVLVYQLLGEPREVGEPFPTSISVEGCPPDKLPAEQKRP